MITQPIDDDIVQAQLGRIAEDGMDIFLLNGAGFRGAVLHGTRMVNQMRANHQLGILETLLLGHSYLAIGLMTSLVKGNDRVSMTLECDGPAKGFSVDSNARGEIRGYLRVNAIPLDGPVESFDLAPYIGNGNLSITRHLEMGKRPFTGTVELVHGNLAKDLANYFVVSEQSPTAFALSIQFDREGRVSGAGGLFLQALPGGHAESGAELEEAVQAIPSMGSMFANGETPAHVINTYFKDFEPEIVGSRPTEFFCSCSRERYAHYLGSLPGNELSDILENGPFPLAVTCHNCGSDYLYSEDEIRLIAQR